MFGRAKAVLETLSGLFLVRLGFLVNEWRGGHSLDLHC